MVSSWRACSRLPHGQLMARSGPAHGQLVSCFCKGGAVGSIFLVTGTPRQGSLFRYSLWVDVLYSELSLLFMEFPRCLLSSKSYNKDPKFSKDVKMPITANPSELLNINLYYYLGKRFCANCRFMI